MWDYACETFGVYDQLPGAVEWSGVAGLTKRCCGCCWRRELASEAEVVRRWCFYCRRLTMSACQLGLNVCAVFLTLLRFQTHAHSG